MLERLDKRAGRPGIVGVNIGANRHSEDRVFDYVAGVRLFAPLASYLTVNVSSPNTPGLRALQQADALAELLRRIGEARAAAQAECGRRTPLLLKIAPDLDDKGLAETDRDRHAARRRRAHHRQHHGGTPAAEIETAYGRARRAFRPAAPGALHRHA